MMALSRNWTIVCGVALCTALVGCDGAKDDFKPAKQVQKDRAEIIKEKSAHSHDHGHHHHAQHHGSLTMLGDHVAQIELTVDATKGDLTAYIFDGEAEHPLTIDQAILEAVVTPDGATEPITLKLAPVDAAKQQDGFTAQHDKLKGVTKLKGTLASLKLHGKDKADEKITVEFDAKKAEEEAEEAHKDGHHDEHGHSEHGVKEHGDKEHKGEGQADAHKDHDEKDHKHADDEPAGKKAE